ncbi:hypothetical protein ABPG77_006720 [Micractinium sp. CCAP 211/92]
MSHRVVPSRLASAVRGAAPRSTSPAVVGVLPMLCLASCRAAALAPGRAARRLGVATQRYGIMVGGHGVAASSQSSKSQPDHQVDEPPAERFAPHRLELPQLSLTTPTLISLCCYLGCQLLAGVPAVEAAMLGALAGTAQLMVAAASRVWQSHIRWSLHILHREAERRKRAGAVAEVMAKQHVEARKEASFSLVTLWTGLAGLSVWALLVTALHVLGITEVLAGIMPPPQQPPAQVWGEGHLFAACLALSSPIIFACKAWRAWRVFWAAAEQRQRENVAQHAQRSQRGAAAQQ